MIEPTVRELLSRASVTYTHLRPLAGNDWQIETSEDTRDVADRLAAMGVADISIGIVTVSFHYVEGKQS